MDPYNQPPRVEIEGENRRQSYQIPSFETPKIVKLVINYSGGLIRDEKQANYFLIGFVAIAIIVASFLFFSLGHTQQKTSIPVEPIRITPTNQLSI